MHIIEQFLASKTGRESDCEDGIHVGRHYLAVIDGATSKSSRRIQGLPTGRAARNLVLEGLDALPPELDAWDAIKALTEVVAATYRNLGLTQRMAEEPFERATASIAVYSIARREVWLVGDCQCLIHDVLVRPVKRVDQLMGRVRAFVLRAESLRGQSPAELLARDPGREAILPLLHFQARFQNRMDASGYGFGVLDGFPVPCEFIRIMPVSSGEVVLATDGYPALKPTLAASESALKRHLNRNPLCIGRAPATKGLAPGNTSFDDRAYLRFET